MLTASRIAVIGAGRMGEIYARLVDQHPLAELAGLVCHTETSAERLRGLFPVPVVSGGDLAALSAAVTGLDAVIVATPEWAHLEPVRWAVERGLPVLLEKPMAGNLTEALKIAGLVEAASGLLTLCHIVRFDPRYAALRQIIAMGNVGAVRQMYARRNADQVAAARILGKCDPAFWLTPHDIDIMRWITGAEVVSVTAQTIAGGSAASDGLFTDLRFSNGAVGRIENSWATPPAHHSRNCLFDVQGDAGSVEVEAWSQGVILRGSDDRATSPNTTEVCEVNGRLVGACANMIDDFVQVTATGRNPAVSMQDGLATIRVADAISRALASGGSVSLVD